MNSAERRLINIGAVGGPGAEKVIRLNRKAIDLASFHTADCGSFPYIQWHLGKALIITLVDAAALPLHASEREYVHPT